MPILTNRNTGTPVTVPDELVERFRAAGFTDAKPAAPAPEVAKDEKPAPRRRRTTKSE